LPAGQARLFGAAAQIIASSFHIEVELSQVRLSRGTYFIDNGIISHGDSVNSTGVQITGGCKPLLRHTCSIIGRKTALVKWRQFHVRR
jgi:hypothetical protein